MEESTVSLREYFEAEIKNVKAMILSGSQEAKDAVKAALDSQKEAVLKSETASEKRFTSVNEFRNTLSDQQRNLMPRVEVEILMKSVSERIDSLSKLLDSRADGNEKRIITLESSGKGVGVGMGYIIGIVGVVSIVASIIMGFIK